MLRLNKVSQRGSKALYGVYDTEKGTETWYSLTELYNLEERVAALLPCGVGYISPWNYERYDGKLLHLSYSVHEISLRSIVKEVNNWLSANTGVLHEIECNLNGQVKKCTLVSAKGCVISKGVDLEQTVYSPNYRGYNFSDDMYCDTLAYLPAEVIKLGITKGFGVMLRSLPRELCGNMFMPFNKYKQLRGITDKEGRVC